MIAVTPLGIKELGTIDHNLCQLDALACVYFLGDDTDASAEAEDKAGVGSIKDQVPTGQQHLAGRGDGGGGIGAGHDSSLKPVQVRRRGRSTAS